MLDRLLLVAISFALATLTYLVIEKQVRYRRSRLVPSILAGLMLFVAGGSYATYSENGYPSRVERFVRIEQAYGQWDYPSSDMTTTQFEGIPVRERDSHVKSKVLFIGDSNMEMYWPRVQQLINDNPDQVKSAVFVTNAGCPPIPGVKDRLHPNCDGWIEKAARYASTQEFDTIVVASNWLGYFNFGKTYSITHGDTAAGMTTKDGLRQSLVSLQSMLEGFRKGDRKVVLLLNIPNNYALASRNLVSRSITGFRIKEGGLPRKDFVPYYHDVRAGLVQAAQVAGASIIDPMDDLCQNGFCPAWFGDGGDPIYKDGDHLSALFVRHNATFIDQTIAVK